MRWDFDLDFLESAAALLDANLEHLEKKTETSPDPDQFGIFDEIEYISGFGLVACQTYMTSIVSRAKFEKRKALTFGPKYKTGHTIAQIVNSAANYWKHNPEWSFDSPITQAKQTLDVLASLNIETKPGYYPVMNTLYEILVPNPTRFANLIPLLIQWRDSLPRRTKS